MGALYGRLGRNYAGLVLQGEVARAVGIAQILVQNVGVVALLTAVTGCTRQASSWAGYGLDYTLPIDHSKP